MLLEGRAKGEHQVTALSVSQSCPEYNFEFRGNKNKMINNSSTKEINKTVINTIKWRFQKKLDNGQVISYIEDKENKLHCAVNASKRIVRGGEYKYCQR